MNLEDERREYEAAGALAHELPYWGWLPDHPFCLTRAGELLAVAQLRPATLDGRTPNQLDQVLGRWQRLLSQLPPGCRFYFYFLRRPLAFEAIEGLEGVAAISQERRRAFLAARVQELQTFVVWSYNPGLRQAGRHAPGLINSALALPRAWLRKRRKPDAQAFLRDQVDQASARFGQIVEASRALVDDITPVTILDPGPATVFLSEAHQPAGPTPGRRPGRQRPQLAARSVRARSRTPPPAARRRAGGSLLDALSPRAGPRQPATRPAAARSAAHPVHRMAAQSHRGLPEKDPGRPAPPFQQTLLDGRAHAGDRRHRQRHGRRHGGRRILAPLVGPRRARGRRRSLWRPLPHRGTPRPAARHRGPRRRAPPHLRRGGRETHPRGLRTDPRLVQPHAGPAAQAPAAPDLRQRRRDRLPSAALRATHRPIPPPSTSACRRSPSSRPHGAPPFTTTSTPATSATRSSSEPPAPARASSSISSWSRPSSTTRRSSSSTSAAPTNG